MGHYKTSIYCHMFNVASPQCNFDYRAAVQNFAQFADEVVCATFPCEDKSEELLLALQDEFKNFRVIITDISPKNHVRWDGLLKTAALQATTNPVKIIMDGDERIPLSNKPMWDLMATLFMETGQNIDGVFIPSLDCWGDPKKIRVAVNIGQKFRMHKDTIKSRGVVPWAENGDGTWDATKSDNTEPLREDGSLGLFGQVVPSHLLNPVFSPGLSRFPYVLHYGYVSLEARIKLNKIFWKDTWASYSGHEENVATELAELEKEPTIEHGLPLE